LNWTSWSFLQQQWYQDNRSARGSSTHQCRLHQQQKPSMRRPGKPVGRPHNSNKKRWRRPLSRGSMTKNTNEEPKVRYYRHHRSDTTKRASSPSPQEWGIRPIERLLLRCHYRSGFLWTEQHRAQGTVRAGTSNYRSVDAGVQNIWMPRARGGIRPWYKSPVVTGTTTGVDFWTAAAEEHKPATATNNMMPRSSITLLEGTRTGWHPV
jgi:hypothetical protein